MGLRASAGLGLSLSASGAEPARGWPIQESDYVIHDFHFASGETLPELRFITRFSANRTAIRTAGSTTPY